MNTGSFFVIIIQNNNNKKKSEGMCCDLDQGAGASLCATAKKEKRLLVAATVYHTDSLGPLQASLAGGARLYPPLLKRI